jgi:DNA-binding response OmpR family regulator
MLTARSSEDATITGLETGADDYMTKPFSVRELTARLKALLRRSGAEVTERSLPESIQFKQLNINPSMRKVTLNEKRIELTPKEFDLLYLLAQNPGVTFDRSMLLNKVWGYNFDGYEHTVNSHINRLRMKVEPDPTKPIYILTTWGVGYRFADA